MKDEEIESMRRIEPLVKSPKIQALQKRVIDIRKDAIDNNEELLAIAMKSLNENDMDCFYANDDEEARKILLDLINEEIEESTNPSPTLYVKLMQLNF